MGPERPVPLVALLLVALSANAANYALWVHGRDGGGQPGNYEDFTGWGPASVNAGVNKKAVNWDGRSRISTQAFRLRNALDCYCTGPNWCYVAAHSAGSISTAAPGATRRGPFPARTAVAPTATAGCKGAGTSSG